MDKNLFDFHNPALDAGTAAAGSLSVLVGSEGFSLYATGSNGAVQALKAWNFAPPGYNGSDNGTSLRMIFGSEPLLSLPFQQVRYAIFNRYATLVPRRMFDADHLPDYFKLLLPSAEYAYRYDVLPEFECFLVYAADPDVIHICDQYFPSGRPIHLATALLKSWRNLVPLREYGVCANLRNQVVQIAVFDRQNLIFYNAFDFAKPVDLLYFVLLAYEQFRLDPGAVALTVSGHIEADSETFKLLDRYIRTIRFATLPAQSGLPSGSGNLPEHFWFDLFSVATTL